MSRRSGLSKERQTAIAREMGLLPPEEGVQVHRRAYVPIEAKVEEPRAAHEPWVCHDCPGGRHKVPGGTCIDGQLWSHGELFEMKRLDALEPGMAKRLFNNKALMALRKTLDLDFSNIKVTHVA